VEAKKIQQKVRGDSMQIVITGKNFKLKDSLREYVEEKLGRLGKYFDEQELEIDVNMVRTHAKAKEERCNVDVTVWVNGISIRGESQETEFHASIDMVVDKIEKQLKKYKDRIKGKTRRRPEKLGVVADILAQDSIVEVDEEFTEPTIIRTRGFAMKPMSVEEAAEQLHLLKQEFFVFSNARSNEVNVIYRRADGNFGLIEPSNR
jgi:putative sigma-54 modulation protein